MAVVPTIQAQRSGKLITRRAFTTGVAAMAGVLLYADEISRHELEVTERTFYLARLPATFEGFRIVQISDLHLEEYTEDFFLRRVIKQVNDLAADMVLVTGDYISRGPLGHQVAYAAAPRCAQLLSTVTCPVRYGVLGNHDQAVGPTLITDHLEDNGWPILGNKNVRIERNGEYLWLAGVNSVSGGGPNLNEAIPDRADAPVILMAHEPDFFDSVVTHQRGRYVDLVLSGHTHGGQVRLPGIRPLLLPPLGRIYPEGHYIFGNKQLYVNRGIGTVGVPFRLNCTPEITVITLRQLPQQA